MPEHGHFSAAPDWTVRIVTEVFRDIAKAVCVPADQLGAEKPSASLLDLADAQNKREK